MRVLIVAKTRRGSGACVGGIAQDGRSVRLVAHDAAVNQHAGLEYEIGQVWEIDFLPDKNIEPPHVENIVVLHARRVSHVNDLEAIIGRFMPPITGGPDRLFDGLARATSSGSLYISQKAGLPCRSTQFWIPDKPLVLDCEGKRIRYRYPTNDGGRSLTFVGFQEPAPAIPAGTLLRISLAHWWRPSNKPDEELRCFAQLSGWYAENMAAVDLSSCPVPSAVAAKVPPGCKNGHSHASVGLDQARQVLKDVFGFSDFLPAQSDVIARVLQGHDTLALMPTGGGKSLCYQLPALLFDGLTVVVSPLIALMEDQVNQLRELELPATFLNSTVSHDDYVAAANRIRHGGTKILYVAPETLRRPETILLLEQSRLACFTVDEAHCISEWGHDFRPDYRELQAVRRRFPRAVCLALTATATLRVREDVRRLLGIPHEGEFIASFNRPNLFLIVEPRDDGLAQILAFLKNHRGQSGIVYCGTRHQVDELVANLNANGWPALPYHGGLEKLARRRNQNRFIHDDVPLMVATIAFGMGINKSNVRFVIHYHLPKDIESYYQEIGRAGRDGLPAECLLLYSRADAMIHRHHFNVGAASQREGRDARLNSLMRYAETTGCRRIPLLAYFAEQLERPCGRCDNCLIVRSRSVARLPETAGAAPEAELFERLSKLRRKLADEAGVPAYMIFSDRALTEMASLMPQDETQFLSINGVGEVKLGNYGSAFLQAICDHCGTHGLSSTTPASKPAPAIIRVAGRRRHEEIGELFMAGQSIESIAMHCRVKPETVIRHLSQFQEFGGQLDPLRVLGLSRLPEPDRQIVLDAFKRFGTDRLAPIHEALAGTVSYDELHLLRLYLRCHPRESSPSANE